MLVVRQLGDISKTHTTDNIEKTTAIKIARVASLSASLDAEFPAYREVLWFIYPTSYQNIDRVLGAPVFMVFAR